MRYAPAMTKAHGIERVGEADVVRAKLDDVAGVGR